MLLFPRESSILWWMVQLFVDLFKNYNFEIIFSIVFLEEDRFLLQFLTYITFNFPQLILNYKKHLTCRNFISVHPFSISRFTFTVKFSLNFAVFYIFMHFTSLFIFSFVFFVFLLHATAHLVYNSYFYHFDWFRASFKSILLISGKSVAKSLQSTLWSI